MIIKERKINSVVLVLEYDIRVVTNEQTKWSTLFNSVKF